MSMHLSILPNTCPSAESMHIHEYKSIHPSIHQNIIDIAILEMTPGMRGQKGPKLKLLKGKFRKSYCFSQKKASTIIARLSSLSSLDRIDAYLRILIYSSFHPPVQFTNLSILPFTCPSTEGRKDGWMIDS